MACGVWCVVCGVWGVVRGVVCGMWCVVYAARWKHTIETEVTIDKERDDREVVGMTVKQSIHASYKVKPSSRFQQFYQSKCTHA